MWNVRCQDEENKWKLQQYKPIRNSNIYLQNSIKDFEIFTLKNNADADKAREDWL